MKAIDLFSGVGGFSIGFQKAGFSIVKAVEFDKSIANSYTYNYPFTKMLNDDIKNLDNEKFFRKNECEVIIGGPPCQGFSMAGSRNRSGFIDDERNYLFRHYFNIVKIINPKVFILENVKGILTMHKGKVFREIIKLFKDSKNFNGHSYYLYSNLVNAKDFGIPQNRERVIIIGVLDTEINYSECFNKTKKEIILYNNKNFFSPVTVWEAISNLSVPTENGEVINKPPESEYQKSLYCPINIITNHKATKHSKIAVDRMSRIKQNENYASLNEKIRSVHSGAYGRLSPNSITQTITTRFDTPSGGRFIHPFKNRTITPREAARLQSFPDDFCFIGNKSSVIKQIGNAVPPKMAYFYGVMVRRILNEYFDKK